MALRASPKIEPVLLKAKQQENEWRVYLNRVVLRAGRAGVGLRGLLLLGSLLLWLQRHRDGGDNRRLGDGDGGGGGRGR